MRKVQVLGIELYDYTVREAMRKVEEFLKDGRPSTIAYVNIAGIMEADEKQPVKEFYQKMDLIVSADSDILRAADIDTKSRIREIDDNTFFEEFLKKMVRQRKTVYLLSETDAGLLKLETSIRTYQESLRIVGRFALEHLDSDEDFVVNDINMHSPNVLISTLPSFRRIEFYDMNHMKLNANIWLMLKDDVVYHSRRKGLVKRISDKLLKSIFKKRLLEYQNENEEDKQNES